MASFVVRPNGILQYDICIRGKRFREGTGLPDTPANRQRMRKNIRRLNAELETGAFSYAAWFPDSKKIEAAERLLREDRSDDPGQRFAPYAWGWYAMCKGDWKPAYRTRVALTDGMLQRLKTRRERRRGVRGVNGALRPQVIRNIPQGVVAGGFFSAHHFYSGSGLRPAALQFPVAGRRIPPLFAE